MRFLTKIAWIALGLLSTTICASSSHAQAAEVNENAPPVIVLDQNESATHLNASSAGQAVEPLISASGSFALMDQCNTLQLEKDAIGERLIEQITLNNEFNAENVRLSDELALCQAGRAIDEETLISLRESLKECAAPEDNIDPEVITVLEEQIADLKTQVAEFETQVSEAEAALFDSNAALKETQETMVGTINENQALRARLETLGYPFIPGFSYLGGDSPSSYIKLGDLRSLNYIALLPEAGQCDALISWMREQATEGRRQVPIRLEVWVSLPNGVAICSPNASGGVEIGPLIERTMAEAHAIVFQ